MPRLATRLAPGRGFDHWLGSGGRVGRGGQGGVGGILAEAGLQVADDGAQVGHLAFQRRDACVALPTTRTTRLGHSFRLHSQAARSCAASGKPAERLPSLFFLPTAFLLLPTPFLLLMDGASSAHMDADANGS